ncbi:hypothetical protein [Brockia lithotrophica]|uniref:Type IV pilus assembly protein PilO n=1 Tax=Brockia lithotrophica TaxID=933949 RepID=A0A660L5L6_9BACL|nr:hypothetical protein [Brockia lithotrophica]RKQ88625.1 hypothetical protein C7438_0264 [Brockia lithotrophica]
MLKRPLSRTEKLLLAVLVLGVGIFAYLRYVYDPILRTYEESRNRLQELRQAVSGAQIPSTAAVQKEIDALKEELKRKEEEREKSLGGKLREGGDVALAVAEVYELARRYHVELREVILKQIEPGKEDAPPNKPQEAFTWRVYEFAVSGRTQDVAEFVRSLSERRYVVYLENFEAKPEKKDDARFQARLKLLF